MTPGVEQARVGSAGERDTLGSWRGLCMQFRVAGAGEGAILNGNYREERTFPTHRKHR